MNQKNKTYKIRIRWTTWKKLRHYFPAERNESIPDYLERISNDIIIERFEDD